MWKFLEGFWGGEWEDTPFVNLEKLTELLATFAFYATLVVFVGLIIYAIVIRNRDEQYLTKSRRLIVGIVVGYSVGVISILGFARLLYYHIDGKVNTNFWLMVGMFALAIVGLIVTLLLKKHNIKGYKWSGLAFAVAFVVYAIVIACVIPAKKEAYEPLNGQSWLMYLTSAILVIIIVAIAVLGGKETEYNAKSLTYGAVCVALSYALSYVKVFDIWEQGGSVTFASLLPLALYSYMFGTRKGLVAGVVYGMLQFIQSPQFYQPMQVLLDYPIAFGAIGIAGFSRKLRFLKGNMIAEFVVGVTVAVILRYVAHVISGYFVFSSWNWAPEKWSALEYSLIYNVFAFADLGILLVVGVLALSTKTLRRTIMEVQNTDFQTNE